jgi:hypothetical protein
MNNLTWDVLWSIIMIVINSINFLLAISIFRQSKKWSFQEQEQTKYFTYLRIMGLIFVSVALYRSVFVSSYPNRLAWHDTLLNSPFIIRSLASFAEMSFIGMIAIILQSLNNILPTPNKFLYKTPLIAVGCIFLAQFFAFAGLITQYLVLFAVEETLWGLAFLSILPLVIIRLKQTKTINVSKSIKAFLIVMAIWCIGYCIFQWGIALPFIHFADLSSDVAKVVPADALGQAIFNFTVTRDFETWGGIGFFIWHSGYFSLCVWMSLLFMSAPRAKHNKI